MSEVGDERSADARWALVDKLKPPHQRIQAVVRHGLLQRLRDASPITLVSAPAGFGKSTLLAQWFHDIGLHSSRHAAWIGLDDGDREVTRFVANLILAAAHAGLPVGPLAAVAHDQLKDMDVDVALADLIARIHAAPAGMVLFLDDFHRACGPDVLARLAVVMNAVGDRLTLVVCGRQLTGLRIVHLAARGLVTRVDASDLAMSESEAAALMGDRLAVDVVRDLHRRTEGWAVALQLARLWHEREDGRAVDLGAFSGRQPDVAAYLAEQVLADLAPPLRTFLLETAILERFDADLANAVRDRDDSAEQLARLSHLDALLVPVDASRESFRYHHLFADYLRQTLRRERPSDLAALHGRAAAWWAARRELSIAIGHAVQSGDAALAASFFAAAGGWELILFRGLGFVRGLLRHFDDATIEATPSLALAKAYLAMKCGDAPRARALLMSADLQRAVEAPIARGRLILTTLLRIYADDLADTTWLADCERDCERLQADDALGRGALLTTGAVLALANHRFVIAERIAQKSIDTLSRTGSELLTIHGRLHRARSFFARGRLRDARIAYREALDIAAETVDVEPAGHTWARCFLAQIAYWQGEAEVARHHLNGAHDRLIGHDSYHDVYLCFYDTSLRIALGRGDIAAARQVVDLAETTARRLRFPRLAALVPAWLVLWHLQRGDLDLAQRLARDHGLERSVAAGLEQACHWRAGYEAAMALGRIDLVLLRSAAASRRWQPLLERARAYGMTFETAQLELMMARVMLVRGDRASAAPMIGTVLDFAMREEARGLLTVEGASITHLLREAPCYREESSPSGPVHSFVATLPQAPHLASSTAGELSAREREVLACLCRGDSNKQIATSLELSENTVKFHMKNVFRKLGVDTRLNAVNAARERGLTVSRSMTVTRVPAP